MRVGRELFTRCNCVFPNGTDRMGLIHLLSVYTMQMYSKMSVTVGQVTELLISKIYHFIPTWQSFLKIARDSGMEVCNSELGNYQQSFMSEAVISPRHVFNVLLFCDEFPFL